MDERTWRPLHQHNKLYMWRHYSCCSLNWVPFPHTCRFFECWYRLYSSATVSRRKKDSFFQFARIWQSWPKNVHPSLWIVWYSISTSNMRTLHYWISIPNIPLLRSQTHPRPLGAERTTLTPLFQIPSNWSWSPSSKTSKSSGLKDLSSRFQIYSVGTSHWRKPKTCKNYTKKYREISVSMMNLDRNT